jgi:hypothetical protein
MITFKTPAVRYGVVLASLVLAFALAPTALAGKAGGGSKPGGGHTLSGGQTLTGVVGSTTFKVTGSGFQPNQFVALSIGVANGCCSATNVTADASGHFTYTGWLVGAGKYFVSASAYSGRGWQVVATWSTQVS